ncbi:hypothetical protein PtB15_17B222 [Puccinia triticina]|nr:hypothetical protein PtB15_17B222 [Puccinia triticina]
MARVSGREALQPLGTRQEAGNRNAPALIPRLGATVHGLPGIDIVDNLIRQGSFHTRAEWSLSHVKDHEGTINPKSPVRLRPSSALLDLAAHRPHPPIFQALLINRPSLVEGGLAGRQGCPDTITHTIRPSSWTLGLGEHGDDVAVLMARHNGPAAESRTQVIYAHRG